MLAAIGAEGEDGTRRLRSRRLDGPDAATAVLALRGLCDSFPESIAEVAIAGSAPEAESLVEEVNSVMARSVVLGDDAALLLARGALLASADRRDETAPAVKRDPLTHTLAMVVATAVADRGGFGVPGADNARGNWQLAAAGVDPGGTCRAGLTARAADPHRRAQGGATGWEGGREILGARRRHRLAAVAAGGPSLTDTLVGCCSPIRDIRAEIAAKRLAIEPFDDALVQPSSVDVRLDTLFRVFNNTRYTHIDPASSAGRADQPGRTRGG